MAAQPAMSVPLEAQMENHDAVQWKNLKTWMKKQMERLTDSGNIAFPKCLSKRARMCGHQVAGSLKLKHDTHSSGDDRWLVVSKGKDPPVEKLATKMQRTMTSMPDPPKHCVVQHCHDDRISPIVYSRFKGLSVCKCQRSSGAAHAMDFYNGEWVPENRRQKTCAWDDPW